MALRLPSAQLNPARRGGARRNENPAENLTPICPVLIENEMRSREKSSDCKQSTYETLIANEIQRAALTLSEVEGSFSRPACFLCFLCLLCFLCFLGVSSSLKPRTSRFVADGQQLYYDTSPTHERIRLRRVERP